MIKIADTTHYASDKNTEGQYIPKSYQFERDMDREPTQGRMDSLQFDEDANIHFVYSNMKDLLTTTRGQKALADMLQMFFESQKDRLSILDGYSKGKNFTILNGRKRLEKLKSDYRVAHNWGGYIADYTTGYVMTNPVTIGTRQTDDDESESLKDIIEINRLNDADTLNFELAFDTSRFGRAFELHYRDTDKIDRFVQIDPQEMFVIRSIDVSKRMIGAVHVPVYNGRVHMTIYTADKICKFKPFKNGAIDWNGIDIKTHMYKDVPVVEWWNDRFRIGDIENVIPLIDAYDSAQSDTANYMSDLNDALLVIGGDLTSANLTANDLIQMKDANILALESGTDTQGKQTNLTAEYIYKQYDVTGSEAYKTRIVNDIYKLSKVPNLEDDRFNAQQSGVALRYKLLGLEQKRSIKESFYSRALRRRYRLIANIHDNLSDSQITADDLTFTFHENIPEDIWSEVESYLKSGGEISMTTLMEMASFIEHPADELKRILTDNIRPDASDEEKQFLFGSDE